MVPLLRGRASFDALAVEVRHHRGSVDCEPVCEIVDGVARAVSVDKHVDVVRAKSPLSWVRHGERGSEVGSRSVLAGRLRRGV